jgi:hypothetical protein
VVEYIGSGCLLWSKIFLFSDDFVSYRILFDANEETSVSLDLRSKSNLLKPRSIESSRRFMIDDESNDFLKRYYFAISEKEDTIHFNIQSSYFL